MKHLVIWGSAQSGGGIGTVADGEPVVIISSKQTELHAALRFTDGSRDFHHLKRSSEFPRAGTPSAAWTSGQMTYRLHPAPTREEVVPRSFLLLNATCSRFPICWRRGCQHLHYCEGVSWQPSGSNFTFRTSAARSCPR